jgi:hypothetical protein
MNGRGHAGAAAQRVLEVDGPVMLLQQVAKRFVREFLKVLHLIVAEKIDLPPRCFVELHALAWHDLASSRLPTVAGRKLPRFPAASKADLIVRWPSTVPPALI